MFRLRPLEVRRLLVWRVRIVTAPFEDREEIRDYTRFLHER